MSSRSSRKVFPMTSFRNRFVALAMVALVTASAVVITAPAATAQDAVPTKPGVVFTPIPNVQQSFYLRFPNLGSDEGPQADCGATDQFFLALEPHPESDNLDPRQDCRFSSSSTTNTLFPDSATFSAPAEMFPKKRVSFTGNDSFIYHHSGNVPNGVTLSVEVLTESTSIAKGTWTVDDDHPFPQALRLNLTGTGATTGRVEMLDNHTFKLVISASSPSGGAPDPTAPSLTAPAWFISDQGASLEIRADDAISAALWITDEKDALRDVFAPIANASQLPSDVDRRVVGHFALRSAFGYSDASRGSAPRFTVLLDGRQREIAPGGQTVLVGVINDSASIRTSGMAVWSFPAGTVNYRGFQSGEYTLHVEKTHHQNAPINRAVDKTFAITAQSVDLKPFSDPRAPTLIETQAHSLQAGGSTTYLLAVNNTGFVNDTFTINLTAVNPPAGWGASIGGPDTLSRRLFVPAHETRIFTLTVNAPASATGEIIHLVNVTSTVDPGTRSKDLTLVTRVSNEVVREVGIVFLPRDLSLDPGVETTFPVYVWNRGTRAANVALEIQETAILGWDAQLAFGNSGAHRIVLGSVQPGDISEATLKITGPANAATNRHDINLNATYQEPAGISSDRPLTFTLRSVSGVSVQVLNTLGAREHFAELSGTSQIGNPTGGDPLGSPNCNPNSPTGIDCTDDGVDGLWFRIWVTNTGKVPDTFRVSGDSFRKPSGCTSAFTAGTDADAIKYYVRTASGTRDERNTIEALAPGKTAEFYAWLPVNRHTDGCSNDFYNWIVQARGVNTGAIGRAAASAKAGNTARPHGGGVYLEGVVRDAGYNAQSPLVDVQNATKRTIVGAIRPGANTTFYVRMTNTASWSNYTDNNVRRSPDLHAYLIGVDREGGWNVSIRPVLSSTATVNPYLADYNLTNENTAVNPTQREAWIDRELEVVVQAPTPENGTVLAGTRHEFLVVAEGANGTGDQSTLEIATIVSELADVTLRADQTRVLAHPGDPGAFLLYVSNNGSTASVVTLRASMNADNTQNAPAWQVNPNAQTFPLAAFKNRTIALLVTPPAGSTQGSTGEVNVTIEYVRSPFFPTVTTTVTQRLTMEVAAPGTLQLTGTTTATTIAPGGTANFTMQLKNTGSLQTPFRLASTPIPNWTVTASPDQGTLNPGETRTVVLVMTAPRDVVNDSRYATVVTASEPGGPGNNFDTLAFTVNILGGQALPRLSVPNLAKRVDRSGIQYFEVQAQNVGTAPGRLALEARSQDPSWLVGILDSRGNNITSVQLGVNELVNINVSVRAPFAVPERTITPVEVTAFSPDQTQAAKATLSAEIHDYGVQLTLVPTSKDGLPGLPTEFIAKLKNTGNDNDTLNLSVNLIDFPEWSAQLSSEDVRLEPNQELEVRATLRSPTTPLPTSRAYTFPFWVGTRGGQAVNISKNMTVSAVLTIPSYRAYDVDKDGSLEIAVDSDKRASNGFEEFKEIFPTGSATQVIADAIFEGRTTFFLDVPRDRPYDGVADVWFNPETVQAFEITHAPDINGDGTPDYLLDTDRDGKIDKAFDSATERFWDVTEVKVFGDDRIQYLVDTTGDGRPDRFYDPESKKVTRTQTDATLGQDYVGIDVDDDKRVDYYYNTRTKQTSGAEVQNFGGFAVKYWYFFVAFAVLVLVSVLLLVRRKRGPPAP